MPLMSSRTWMLLLLLITIAVRLPTMFGVKRNGWDEHAYAYFAQTLNDRGIPGLQALLKEYPSDENLKKSPLPLRIGFIVPAMVTCQLLGGFNGDNIAWLAFCCGVALVLVGARLADQLAGGPVSIICAALLITSPLSVALSRRGMSDNLAALLMLSSLYIFDRCWRRRSPIDLAAFGLVLCAAMLTKESAILLYPMMLVAGVYYHRMLRLRISAWVAAPLILAPAVYFMVEIAMAAGLKPLLETYRVYAGYQQTLDYTTRFEKGPWFRFLLDFFALAPLTFLAAVIGCAFPLDDQRRHARNLALIYLVAGILLFGHLPVLNVRLVLFLDTFLRLTASLALITIVSSMRQRLARVGVIGLAAILVISDAVQFYQVFIRANTYNPTTFLLLRAEGFFDVR